MEGTWFFLCFQRQVSHLKKSIFKVLRDANFIVLVESQFCCLIGFMAGKEAV